MSSQYATLDTQRAQRIGFDEAVLCDSKHAAHIDQILEAAGNTALLLTRLETQKLQLLQSDYRDRIDYDDVSRTGWFGKTDTGLSGTRRVAIVTAGTSDVPVAREAARTLGFNNIAHNEIYDVGVAGIWRLMDRVEEIRSHDVVIAVAGMDAALPTVLGGLIGTPIVAVPTSVGYGVATGGNTALNAILASCAPGISVVNIDNGYGAACAALRFIRSTDDKL